MKKEKILEEINKLRIPKDMKQRAWDWYLSGYKDGQDDALKHLKKKAGFEE